MNIQILTVLCLYVILDVRHVTWNFVPRPLEILEQSACRPLGSPRYSCTDSCADAARD